MRSGILYRSALRYGRQALRPDKRPDASYSYPLRPRVLGTKTGLVDLAGRCQRHLCHSDHLVRHPPIGHTSTQRIQQGLVIEDATRLGFDDQNRTFAPVTIGPADDRDLPDARNAADNRFYLCWIDSFATRLDQIFGPAGDGEVPLLVEAREMCAQRRIFPVFIPDIFVGGSRVRPIRPPGHKLPTSSSGRSGGLRSGDGDWRPNGAKIP